MSFRASFKIFYQCSTVRGIQHRKEITPLFTVQF
nr:MAG TPA: hypothetical protein [Caudoviricetes sp.]